MPAFQRLVVTVFVLSAHFGVSLEGAAISVGVSVAASISFPQIAKVTTTFWFQGTFTNTLSTATQRTTNYQQKQTLPVQNQAGKTCHLDFNTQSCVVTGCGKIEMLGTGRVCFQYNDNYKWASSIDEVLKNLDQDDRSTWIKFKATTAASTLTDYKATCV
ncbi:hypothetical protein C8R43DRAFT_958893 [Mycena crocata]|nr:hypothetical protein C8R43DRAFT_958893 [Mycena crocata]